ncbi:MAG: prenyltransferase [Deltaproteobacteria bacterium]|nr:prenyltransferase [Deltaproteobacteria bacterium]
MQSYIWGPMRLPFLMLSPVCVFLGLASAVWTTGRVNTLYAVLALIGALAAHISVNALNEYHDLKSGLDFKTPKTPFSGGSGTLPRHPEKAHVALITGLAAFFITGLIGLYFVMVRDILLLPLGILGLVIMGTYTIWITRNPYLCLIAPGLGFGPLMVMGTDYVLTGTYSWSGFVASLIPFFLVSNLLLLNQFPDIDADRSVGRKHLLITYGTRTGIITYGLFLLATYISIIAGVIVGVMPAYCLMGLASAILAVPAFIGVSRHARNLEKLIPFMGFNVVINLATPVLVGIGFLIG